jgi:hypothetical protein
MDRFLTENLSGATIAQFPWIKKRICKKSFDRNKPKWCTDSIQHNECDGEESFELDIQKDDSADLLTYRVKRRNEQGKFRGNVMQGRVVGSKKYQSKNICVEKGGCYKLIVVDKGKRDGLCCDYGTGFYRIRKNGKSSQFLNLLLCNRLCNE